jgi:hypothetical protein
MNCWGFRPAIVEALREALDRFIADGGVESGEESFLPTVVRSLLPAPAGRRVTALASAEPCLGVTHPADADALRAYLVANRS